jgi:hypothetical protein
MANATLSLTLKQRHEGVDLVPFGAFLDVAQNLLGILRNLTDELNGAGAAGLVWYIARVGQGSIVLDLRGFAVGDGTPDWRGEVVAELLAGLATIERGPVRPRSFSDDSLRRARDMARVLKGGIAAVVLSAGERRVSLTRNTAANVEAVLQPRHTYAGSVEGIVQTICLRDPWYFEVSDALSRRPVECRFGPDLLEEVRVALGRRALVSGEVKTDATGQMLYIGVMQVRPLPSDDDLPQPDEIFGVDPGFTEGVDSAEYVRARRD